MEVLCKAGLRTCSVTGPLVASSKSSVLYLPLFPQLHLEGYSSTKKPKFASIVRSPPSGREVTAFQQLYPLWEFELDFSVLRDQTQNTTLLLSTLGRTDLQTLSAFWIERGSQVGLFIYQDPEDYSRKNQLINITDGVHASYTMFRTFGVGLYRVFEPVGIVDVRIGAALNIYMNGVLIPQPGNWFIGRDLQTIKFVNVPPFGQTITADFSYFYRCRFIEDSLELEEFMRGWWNIKRLRFRSTRTVARVEYRIAGENPAIISPTIALKSETVSQPMSLVNGELAAAAS